MLKSRCLMRFSFTANAEEKGFHQSVRLHEVRRRGRAAAPYFGASTAIMDLGRRSEEHTSELQSLMRISYAVFCLKKKINATTKTSVATLDRNNLETNTTI